jgi:hypothetical protein
MTKPKIIYPQEFRTKCFNNLRHFMDIRLLMSAMDSGRDNIVRYYIETALDDPKLYIKTAMVNEEERKVANNKIFTHAIRQELYDDFMELLTKTMDRKNGRSKLLR